MFAPGVNMATRWGHVVRSRQYGHAYNSHQHTRHASPRTRTRAGFLLPAQVPRRLGGPTSLAARAMTYKPYPEYKDSGAEWLGGVPAHWEVRRLKTVADVRVSNVDKKSVVGETAVRLCNYVDVYYNERITAGLPFMSATASRDQIERFTLKSGDVVITKDSETWDDIAVAAVVTDELDNVLCGYHLALIRPGKLVDGHYLARAFRSTGPRDQFHFSANGITRFGLSNDAITASVFVVPPRDEQRNIASFLDRETAKIDALIEKKERLIELLQEKRTALITRAVTRGLNPDAQLKESGIEWLGQIPAHWSVCPLMHLVQTNRPIMYGIVLPGPDVPNGIPIVKGGDVAPGRLKVELLKRTTPEIESGYARSRLRGGDLVYAIRGSIGAVEIVPSELAGANLTQDAARVAPKENVSQSWLALALRSSGVFAQLDARATGATIRGINIRDLKRVSLPLPPPDEQVQIAESLDRRIGVLAGVQAAIRTGIAQLSEYRSALITAAVTGQIDVRGVIRLGPKRT